MPKDIELVFFGLQGPEPNACSVPKVARRSAQGRDERCRLMGTYYPVLSKVLQAALPAVPRQRLASEAGRDVGHLETVGGPRENPFLVLRLIRWG